MDGVFCADCALFVPDPIGDGLGVGQCHAYDAYKAKGAGDVQLQKAYAQLGGQLFWGGRGGSSRRCSKFKEKVNE